MVLYWFWIQLHWHFIYVTNICFHAGLVFSLLHAFLSNFQTLPFSSGSFPWFCPAVNLCFLKIRLPLPSSTSFILIHFSSKCNPPSPPTIHLNLTFVKASLLKNAMDTFGFLFYFWSDLNSWSILPCWHLSPCWHCFVSFDFPPTPLVSCLLDMLCTALVFQTHGI